MYKLGQRDRVITIYRPISTLPSLSKILERIINNRLVNYLEKHNLIFNKQFGFRAGKSTSDAVHDLQDYVVRDMEAGKKTIGLFLDLAKTFDTISTPLLLKKLEVLGIRGNDIKLFSQYLSQHFQSMNINYSFSSDLPITHGVPQGSILGSSLFLVYVNGLCNLDLPNDKIVTYAD